MNTKPLEKFAQTARRQLHEQVAARLEQVLRTDSPELREKAAVVADLNKQIAQSSRQEVVERVAYTWFNRFCALRYMDANRYTRIGIVSPAAGRTQPEILQEAKAGHIDHDLAPHVDSQRIFDLLSGRLPSPDGQAEAYRELLKGSCNQYHAVMPFMFEKIDDYTELLMPDDLLSANSVLQAVREALTIEACQDVEVIGWLYQFYISEKKDEVIGAKKAISPENIPAATQLFTPNWIVRYLVQNSLGRLWLLNRPNSRLAEQMEFYIGDQLAVNSNQSDTAGDGESYAKRSRSDITDNGLRNTDHLKINSPEDLTICDPAVGSGHMLTYAFDLLYAIYEEEGYNARDIPRLILQKNLTGLEIDERAAALAAFALTMKARAKDRRFFRRGVAPQIVTLRPVAFTDAELDAETDSLLNHVIPNPELVEGEESSLSATTKDSSPTGRNDRRGTGWNDVREALRHDLALFAEADNFGSLLRPLLTADQLTRLRDQLAAPAATGQLQLFDAKRRQKALQAVTQAIPLARQYDVVVANPPYMGSKHQNATLKKFLSTHYKDVKSDLFSAFIVRNLELAKPQGQLGFMTPFVWMFISSYEKLREFLIDNKTITSLVQLEYSGFSGATVPICTFTLENASKPGFKGGFVRLSEFRGAENQAPKTLEAIQNPDCGYFYRAAATDFKKIPGSPIAYWVSNQVRGIFASAHALDGIATIKQGLATCNNDKFLRAWFEVSCLNIGFAMKTPQDAFLSGKKWFPYNKGGGFRKWYGNNEYLVNWENKGKDIHDYSNLPLDYSAAPVRAKKYYFREGITYGLISSYGFSARRVFNGFIFDVGGSMIFPQKNVNQVQGFLGSKLVRTFLDVLNPTLNYQVGDIRRLPILKEKMPVRFGDDWGDIIAKAKNDWDSYEISWDFTGLPLLRLDFRRNILASTYAVLHTHWREMTLEMQRLEEENNRLFIEAYGLQDELTPDVPLSEITLTCNPHYRYSGDKTESELETLLRADTMREFISYAVGCMFGRYSLDKPGLILANQGETVADYVRKVTGNQSSVSSNPITDNRLPLTFPPDEDNAIPILDGDWFPDDITERFKKFLRVTFGEENYAENLAFIETALGKDIRKYFLREFYTHHVKMYKKRPIYWLFSSPKGSFNVLIYMHRYRPDTVSVVLNDYLREFRAKLNARKSLLQEISASASAARRDKTRALKEIDKLDKILKELRDYEDDILYPLATRRVEIDLDDGVKVNYNKFGKALKKVPGLTAK